MSKPLHHAIHAFALGMITMFLALNYLMLCNIYEVLR